MTDARASSRDRDDAIVALRYGFLAGQIHTDTFAARVGAALGARTQRELARLIDDLRRSPAAHDAAPAIAVLAVSTAGAPLLLGRSRRCDVVLCDDSVSRFHALISRRDDGWQLVDLDSTNGTLVNGALVSRALLADGDVLTFGETARRFLTRPSGA